MRIVALLTIRNEAFYLGRCLQHLASQGIEVCVIDNGSSDTSLAIAEKWLNKGVIRIEHLPYNGCFELARILENEQRIAGEIDGDWFIHHDADEIREAPSPFKTLKEGFIAADRQGYNAVNFDEFVFLPTTDDKSFIGTDYVAHMRYYYFFEPFENRRINAWKRGETPIDLVRSGGHLVEFEGRRVFSQNFIMRHYIGLSKEHIISKFAGRVFSSKEITERGWHGTRSSFSPDQLILPEKEVLKSIPQDGLWDRSDPWKKHFFLGDNPVISGKKDAPPKAPIADSDKKSLLKRMHILFHGASNRPKPIPFIIGNMRSGTTLLRLMLDAHPHLAIPSETRFFPQINPLIEAEGITPEQFMEFITTHLTWDDFHIPPRVLWRRLKRLKPFTLSGGLVCFYMTYAKRFGKKRWGDKTPYYGLHMDQLKALFPDARFIHMIRDGRDVALSTRGLWFGLGEGIDEQAGNWMNRIRQMRQLAQIHGDYMEFRYEDLVTDTHTVLHKICEFIDLPFHSDMETYYERATERLEEMASRYDSEGNVYLHKDERKAIFEHVNQPPDRSRICRWKAELTQEEIETFNRVAGYFLRELGYETE
jgi:hypothetical protein